MWARGVWIGSVRARRRDLPQPSADRTAIVVGGLRALTGLTQFRPPQELRAEPLRRKSAPALSQQPAHPLAQSRIYENPSDASLCFFIGTEAQCRVSDDLDLSSAVVHKRNQPSPRHLRDSHSKMFLLEEMNPIAYFTQQLHQCGTWHVLV